MRVKATTITCPRGAVSEETYSEEKIRWIANYLWGDVASAPLPVLVARLNQRNKELNEGVVDGSSTKWEIVQ